MKEYEAAYEFVDLILLTKFRMERLFLQLETYSTDDSITIALKKDDGIVRVNESGLEYSHFLNKSSDLRTPLKEPRHDTQVSEQVVSYKKGTSLRSNQVEAPVPVPCSDDCDPNDKRSRLPTTKMTNNQINENAVQEPAEPSFV